MLESWVIGGDPSERYTMHLRNVDAFESVETYEFTRMLRIAIESGDYSLVYWADTTYLHGEYIHISGNAKGVLQKFVLRYPVPLHRADMRSFRLLTPEDFQNLFIEF